MRIIIFLALAVAFSTTCCGKKPRPIGLDFRIRNYVNVLSDTVTVFKMNIFETLPVKWDEAAIVNPYTPADSILNLDYSNINQNLSFIETYTYREEYAQIILSLDNKIVSIDTVLRDVIDFTELKISNKVNGIEVLNKGEMNKLIFTSKPTNTRTFVPTLPN